VELEVGHVGVDLDYLEELVTSMPPPPSDICAALFLMMSAPVSPSSRATQPVFAVVDADSTMTPPAETGVLVETSQRIRIGSRAENER